MHFRSAINQDISEVIKMLADDELGKTRENHRTPLPKEYIDTFENFIADQNQELIVLEDEDNEITGTLQLTFIQYLAYQ